MTRSLRTELSRIAQAVEKAHAPACESRKGRPCTCQRLKNETFSTILRLDALLDRTGTKPPN